MKRVKGLFRDCDPIDQPEGTYRDARNALLNDEIGTIMSDYGITESDISATLGSSPILLGSTIINDDRVVIFTVDPDGSNPRITLFDSGNFTVILNDSRLNFQPNSLIDSTFRINRKVEAVVYFTDGVNDPRYINVDDPPATISNINELNIFDYISDVPEISLNNVNNSGGSLTTGTYYFALAYLDEEGNQTSYVTISNPIYVNDDVNISDPDSYDGAPAGTPTNKSIEFTISNADDSFDAIQIAVIKKENGVLQSPRLIPEINSDGSTITYTYTGNETFTDGSLDQIFIDNASYETAKTMEQVDDVLYMGNVSQAPDVGFQKYANNIDVAVGVGELEDPITDGADSYKSSSNSFSIKSYQRDEVYAFYLSFVLDDGTESRAYHIPGRQANTGETSDAGGTEEDIIDSDAKQFHFQNDADTEFNTGYWENENETYPTEGEDWEIWDVDSNGDGIKVGDLHDDGNGNPVPVRHHRMPDHDDEPIFYGTDENGKFRYLKIQLRNFRIPTEIAEQVSAVKVYYAKRTDVNKRVIGQSFLGACDIDSAFSSNSDELMSIELRDVPLSNQWGGNGDTFWAMPFNMMLNRPNIGQISHIRPIYKLYGDSTEITAYQGDGTGRLWDLKRAYSPEIDNWAINARAYIPESKDEVETQSKGFDQNAYSRYSEASLMLQTTNTHTLPWGSNANDDGVFNYSRLVNFMSHKTELYNSFDQQQLVYTGFVDNNPSNYDPSNWSTTGSSIEFQDDIATPSPSEDVTNLFERDEQNDNNFTETRTGVLTTDNWYKIKVYVYSKENIEGVVSLNVDTGSGGSYGNSKISASISPTDWGSSAAFKFQNTEGATDIQVSFDASSAENIQGGRIIVEEYASEPGLFIYDPICIGINTSFINNYSRYTFISFEQGETTSDLANRMDSILNASTSFSNDFNTSIINNPDGDKLINITSVNEGNQYNLYLNRLSNNNEPNIALSSSTDTAGSVSPEINGGDTYINRYAHRASHLDSLSDRYAQVVDFVCESPDNIEFRHAGTELEEKYYPKNTIEDVLNIEYEDNISNGPFYDNYYAYNQDYSALGDLKTAIPYSKIQRNVVTDLPTRIIRSQKYEPSNDQDGFRQFLENDFVDLPRNRGELVKLSKFNNMLIPHMERAIVRTKGREELVTGDFRAYLGAGDIFEVPPDEIVMSETGTGGIQSIHHGVLTQYGYFFVDQQDREIYMLGRDGLKSVSKQGMDNYFQDALPWNLKEYASDFDPYNADQRQIGISLGFDNENDRIFFVKRDLDVTQTFIDEYNSNNVTYDSSTGKFSVSGTEIDYSDDTYFTQDNISLSYMPELERWISFHDFAPQFFFRTLNNLYAFGRTDYSSLNQFFYEYNNKSKPLDVGSYSPEFVFRYIDNRNAAESNSYYNIEFITEAEKADGEKNYKLTFDKFRIRNRYQDSGEQDIIYFTNTDGNARHVEGKWKINKFRDMLDDNGNLDQNLEWYKQNKFIGRYLDVELKYSNSNNFFLYLFYESTGFKKSHR